MGRRALAVARDVDDDWTGLPVRRDVFNLNTESNGLGPVDIQNLDCRIVKPETAVAETTLKSVAGKGNL